MFFYLLYNSNIINEDENKLIKLVIYSIVLYIILHIIVNSILCRFPFLGYYFWIIFVLDCLCLGSILVRENNGDILVNDINHIKSTEKQEKQIAIEDEIERTTHNLEELLKETKDIKNMVKQPEKQLDLGNSKEFDRFIEELNNTDIEQKEKQTSIHGFNSSSRDEIPKQGKISHEDEIDKLMGSLQNTDTKDHPKDERERIMESLQNNINSKQNDDVTIDSDIDIDIDISEFDKLIE